MLDWFGLIYLVAWFLFSFFYLKQSLDEVENDSEINYELL